MNPEHAKAFNELRELCRRYKLSLYGNNDGLFLCFNYERDSTYCTVKFADYSSKVTHIIDVDIPPPETKGEKNE